MNRWVLGLLIFPAFLAVGFCRRSSEVQSSSRVFGNSVSGLASEQQTEEAMRAFEIQPPHIELGGPPHPARRIAQGEVLLPLRVEQDAVEKAYRRAREMASEGNFEQARELALQMRAQFPHAALTHDLEQHLLVRPLGLPSRESQMARAD